MTIKYNKDVENGITVLDCGGSCRIRLAVFGVLITVNGKLIS